MDRLDKYFKKHLTDDTPAEDNWNVPSEKMWHNAKEFLPKTEKKPKGIFSLWKGLISVLFIVMGIITINHLSNSKALPSDNLTSEKIDITNNKFNIGGTDLAQTEVIDSPEAKKSNIKPNNLVPNSTKKNDLINRETILNKSENVEIKPLVNKKTNLSIDQPTHTEKVSKAVAQKKSLNDFDLQEMQSSEFGNSDRQLKWITENSSTQTLKQLDESLNQEEIKLTSLHKNASSYLQLNKPNDISSLKFNHVNALDIENLDLDLRLTKNEFITPAQAVFPKAEWGVSTAFFLLDLIDDGNLVDMQDTVRADGTYRNINLIYQKWITPRFSVSTGLHVSHLNVGIDFSQTEILQQDQLSQFANTNFKNNGVERKRADNLESDFWNFNVINGQDVQQGDELRGVGKANVDLKALQVPFLLNYHWIQNKRIEWMAGLGFTLDFIRSFEEVSDFELFKDNVPVIETFNNSRSLDYVDVSLYTTSSIRFHFSKKINLGITNRILITDPQFSSVDIGLFYRLH